MDVPRIPPTLFEALCSQSSQSQGSKKKGRAPNNHRKDRRPDPSFRDLVKEDQLYFRVVTDGKEGQSTDAATSTMATVTAAIEKMFSKVFNAVWSQLPGFDRSRLLGYWRGEIGPRQFGEWFPPVEHRPVIQVFLDEAKVCLGCERAATLLNFSAAQVLDQPEALPLVIARTLASAYHHATRRHAGLILESL